MLHHGATLSLKEGGFPTTLTIIKLVHLFHAFYLTHRPTSLIEPETANINGCNATPYPRVQILSNSAKKSSELNLLKINHCIPVLSFGDNSVTKSSNTKDKATHVRVWIAVSPSALDRQRKLMKLILGFEDNNQTSAGYSYNAMDYKLRSLKCNGLLVLITLKKILVTLLVT